MILYERLLPFALQTASNEGTVQDPIAYTLGLLATCLGNYDDAENRYAMSQSIGKRVGAVYSLARTNLLMSPLQVWCWRIGWPRRYATTSRVSGAR